MNAAHRKELWIAMASIAAVLGLALTMLSGPAHVAAQSGWGPRAYMTVVIANGDDTVSWSDPDGCSSNYNTYLAVTPRTSDAETSRTHLGSATSGSTEVSHAISYTGGYGPSVEVELYCGAYEAGSSQNALVASQHLSVLRSGLRTGTYSTAPLTALSISSGTLSPAFGRGISDYTAGVSSSVTTITLDPTLLAGYQADFVKNTGWIAQSCRLTGDDCEYYYGDGATTGIVLSDADTNAEGFQINLSHGENLLGMGVHKGSVDAGPGKLYVLTITVANFPATGQPTITGTAQVGQTLTADTSGIADVDGLDNVTYSYQWLSGWYTQIVGATSSTYTLPASDEGKTIKVRVSFTDDAGDEETRASEATAAVVAANTPATGAPTISGTAQVGMTLTASVSGIADTDGLDNVAYSYQWLADDAEINRATRSTYTPQTSDEGKTIEVRVTFTDDAGNDESLTSEATAAVVAGGL